MLEILSRKCWRLFHAWKGIGACARSSLLASFPFLCRKQNHDGQRSNKYTQSSETLYFNKMWTLHTDSGNNVYGGQTAKNIYLGDTRIVTKLNSGSDPTYQEEYYKQYYYHGDHLGSASLISDYKGDEYQRIEYTPYGETWIEKTSNTGLEFLPYKFTAKELDKETGLYYYVARYLDPKYSRWISTDPALGEYIPCAPVDEEARRRNQNLPGMGGVFNAVNASLYHYAGNNPVKYTDPDGNSLFGTIAGIGCYIGAGVVLVAGTGLAVTTMGTTVPLVASGALVLAGKLTAAGTAIIAADYVAEKLAQSVGKPSPVLENGATSVASPNPLPPDPDDKNDYNRGNESSSNKLSQSAKDAKRLDNKGAENLAKEKGYKSVHELKEEYVGKDNISEFDIYKNNKTGESFLIKKQGAKIVVPIME